MKILLVLSLLSLIALSCSAKHGAYSKVLGSLQDKVYDKVASMNWMTDEDEFAEIPDDFDDETETAMKIMDAAKEFMDDDDDEDFGVDNREKVKKGRGRPAKSRGKKLEAKDVSEMPEKKEKLTRKEKRIEKKMMKKQSVASKKCASMDDKVNTLCDKIILHPFLDKLLSRWTKKSNKNSKWKTCCSFESQEERMICFNESRTAQLDKICESGKSRKFEDCCNVTDAARVACFDDMKQKACDRISRKADGVFTYKKSMNKMKEEMKALEQFAVERYKKWKGKGKAAQRKAKKSGKTCCKSGHMSRGTNETQTVKFCEDRYSEWVIDHPGYPDFCSNKFVWCCMNYNDNDKDSKKVEVTPIKEKTNKKERKRLTKKNRKTQRKNSRMQNATLVDEEWVLMNLTYPELEYPNETGQVIEEHMEEPKYEVSFLGNPDEECCLAGVNKSRSMRSKASEDDCDIGLVEFVSEWPGMDEKCHSLYMKCCLSPKKRGFVGQKYEKKAFNKAARRDYRDKNGNLPPGMRMSPSGHFYYVDKALPELEIKKGSTVFRKNRKN